MAIYNGTLIHHSVSGVTPIHPKTSLRTTKAALPVTENTIRISASCQFDSIFHFSLNLFIICK